MSKRVEELGTEPLPWVAKWESSNLLDGHREYFIGNGWVLFKTRTECRAYIKEKFGYIAKRKDLQIEPHGWRMLKAIKVRIKLMPE